VSDTYAPASRLLGAGLILGRWGQGTANLERVLFHNNVGGAILAFGELATLRGEDVTVTRTLERDCARTECIDEGLGIGVAAVDGADVTLTRFAVRQSALCGIQVVGASSLALADGLVSDNTIGLNVQSATVDLDALARSVVFINNERNLDSAVLPVPNTDMLPTLE
jgi:hypothetical protein